MTETQATYGDGSSQFDQLTVLVSRKLLVQFQNKLDENNDIADSVIIKFIKDYVGQDYK
jgi:hypothetical protein